MRDRSFEKHFRIAPAAYVTAISLRINDVLGWASGAFYVEEAPRDYSGGLYASLANAISKIAKLSYLAAWILINVYIFRYLAWSN